MIPEPAPALQHVVLMLSELKKLANNGFECITLERATHTGRYRGYVHSDGRIEVCIHVPPSEDGGYVRHTSVYEAATWEWPTPFDPDDAKDMPF
jgi:hypothetical protein